MRYYVYLKKRAPRTFLDKLW